MAEDPAETLTGKIPVTRVPRRAAAVSSQAGIGEYQVIAADNKDAPCPGRFQRYRIMRVPSVQLLGTHQDALNMQLNCSSVRHGAGANRFLHPQPWFPTPQMTEGRIEGQGRSTPKTTSLVRGISAIQSVTPPR